jgi:hypothetical protein
MKPFLFAFGEKNLFALITIEKHLTYIAVADMLHGSHRQELGSVSALLIRPPVERPVDPAEEKKALGIILERFPYLPVYLLYSNHFKIYVSHNLHSADDELEPFPFDVAGFLTVCRQKEMEDFVLNSPAIYKSPARSVFRTPSQEYSTAFLRVGNIQHSRYVLDIIFFWLLPHLEHSGALLADSWSISSICLNIARQRIRYLRHLGQPDEVDEFHVNFLSTYYHGRRKMDRETREVLQPLFYDDNRKKILFLISAVKTQKSLEFLRDEIGRQGYLQQMKFLALYKLQPNRQIASLCNLFAEKFTEKANLPDGFRNVSPPEKGTAVVVIDERTFFPSSPKVKEIVLRKALSDSSKQFFDRYLGIGAISVHRNAYFQSHVIQRHHGLFIDITKLIEQETFRTGLANKITSLAKAPDLIIYPPHDEGEAFVKVVQANIREHFKADSAVYCFADLEILPAALKAEIEKAIRDLPTDAEILVIDDVVTTGNRLTGFQKTLREIPYKGRIHYLVGVARPVSEDTMTSLEIELRHRTGGLPRHSFEYVEKVFLPDWNIDACPWCREGRQLIDIIKDPVFSSSPLLRTLAIRYNELVSGADSGLINVLFQSLNQTVKATFSGGSIFSESKDISEADLLTRVSACIHHLRTVGNKPDGTGSKLGVEYPLYTIIRSKDYLGNTFNEALIKACIIRASEYQELYAAEDRLLQEQKSMILGLLKPGKFKKSEKCFFFYELFLALRSAKLPSPEMTKDWNTILSELVGLPPTGKARHRAKKKVR